MFLFCEHGPQLPRLELHEYVDYYIPFKVYCIACLHTTKLVLFTCLFELQLNKNMSVDKWIARFQLGMTICARPRPV